MYHSGYFHNVAIKIKFSINVIRNTFVVVPIVVNININAT